MRLAITTAGFLICAGVPALAKECRMPDVPPGIRIQVPPECKERFEGRRMGAERPDSPRANQGFVDLGNGTQVRIGGGVRVEAGTRR